MNLAHALNLHLNLHLGSKENRIILSVEFSKTAAFSEKRGGF